MRYPNLKEEKKLWKKGFKKVAGLDEAGRGALAGPVVAAAVLLDLRFKVLSLRFSKVKDSKKLTPKRREELYKILTKNPAIKWRIGRVSEKVIDKINILEATKLAMERAVKKLKVKKQKAKVDFLILDGNFRINSNTPQKSIIKADEKVFSCACASILAKVWRDRIMKKYHKRYHQYRFDKHKGYPTKFHRKMLRKYGPCEIHRKSFGPVKDFPTGLTKHFKKDIIFIIGNEGAL